MKKTGFLHVLFSALLALPLAGNAQDYPAKAVTIVIPFAPGGGTDLVARPVADKLREKWGQSFLLDHRPGAGGNIGAEAVYKAAPDGYTFLFVTPSQVVINKYLYTKLAYNPDEFIGVSVITSSPNVLVVHPKVPAKNVRELVALARANPDKLSFGSSGSGATTHLAAELLKSLTGVKMVHVPYKGAAAYLADMTAGHLDLSFFLLGTALPQIRAGKLRALGVGSEKRNRELPDVPALAEEIPGFSSTIWYAIVAPPRTPMAIVNKVSVGIADALKDPAVASLFAKAGLDSVGSTPAEMALLVRQENERWGKIVRETGAKAD